MEEFIMKKIMFITIIILIALSSTLVMSQDDEGLGIETELLFVMHVNLDPAQAVGEGPYGVRNIVPSIGGTIEGPEINGEILAGGADWILARADGVRELDIRLTIRTDDDHLIYIYSQGLFYTTPGGETYLRITPRFETGAEEYAWLNRTLAVGTGIADGLPEWVEFTVYAIK
jgi:hypothetical protein